MANFQLPLPSPLVKKSNALARARWSIESIWEPRLVALLASKVRVEDADFHIYEIPVNEILHNHGGRIYKEIEAVVDNVISRVITIRNDDGWEKYTVFNECEFIRSKGILRIGFHPKLKPHYLNLKKNFTEYSLMEFLLLPSVYSQRLFEILKSWNNLPEVTIQISELHEMIFTPDYCRKNFREFRRWVLEKAHKDITTHTSLIYDWEPIKKGRSVTEIRFVFSKHRVAIVNKTNNEKNQEKIINRNNKIFIQANNCAKQHKGECLKEEQKNTAVCNLCRELKMLKEYNRLNSGK